MVYFLTVTMIKVWPLLVEREIVKVDSKASETLAEIGNAWWIWLAYIPLINFILVFIIGRYGLTTLLYPYQNSMIRESLDRT